VHYRGQYCLHYYTVYCTFKSTAFCHKPDRCYNYNKHIYLLSLSRPCTILQLWILLHRSSKPVFHLLVQQLSTTNFSIFSGITMEPTSDASVSSSEESSASTKHKNPSYESMANSIEGVCHSSISQRSVQRRSRPVLPLQKLQSREFFLGISGWTTLSQSATVFGMQTSEESPVLICPPLPSTKVRALKPEKHDNTLFKKKQLLALREPPSVTPPLNFPKIKRDRIRIRKQSLDPEEASFTITLSKMTHKDILSGRGSGVNSYPGNQWFRDVVARRRQEYLDATRFTKYEIVEQTVKYFCSEGGRFLEKSPDSEDYREMIFERAFEKTAQALREKNQREILTQRMGMDDK
jgi:hypothetical protein